MTTEAAALHLRYDMMRAGLAGDNRHPQLVMRALGIEYTHATPQSLGDQWWFWNCTSVPQPMPSFLSPLGLGPRDAIGHGVSAAQAEEIMN